MGRHGPQPTPTAILARRGSWRAGARAKKEPQPEKKAPRCPRWLSKEARAVWRQLVPTLQGLGVLAETDGNAMARYCENFVRWRKAIKHIQQYGESYPLKDKNGTVKCFNPWPQVVSERNLAVSLLRLEQEFGLTPAARTRITVDVQETSDPDKDLIKIAHFG